MAWSEAEVICRRHPNEAPQQGVCPSCLRERLCRITGNKSSRTYNISSSSPSQPASPVYYYCHSSASSSSPQHRHRRRHYRVASDIMDSIYLALGGGSGLKKSRSMAYEPRKSVVSEAKKKGGFWNRLMLRSSGKKAKFW